MKKNRRVYGLILILSGIFVYVVPGTISAALFYMLLIIPVCSLIYTCITYGVFKVKQEIDSRHILKGSYAQLTCSIYNDSFFLFPPMELKLLGDSLLFTEPIEEEEFILTPMSNHTYTYLLEFKYRGAFYVGIESVIIKDPFRLFSLKFKEVEAIKIMVYPHIIAMNDIDLLMESHRENTKRHNLVLHDAHSLSEIRPYQYGDTKKNIHWKISAKMQQWMIKTKKEKLRKKVVILLDTKSLDVSKERRLFLEDYCIELVVGHIKVFLDHWIPTRLLFNDLKDYDLLATGPKGFSMFYKELAKVNYTTDNSMESLINRLVDEKCNGDYQGILHVFSFHVSKSLISKLITIKGRDKQVFVHYIMNQSVSYKEKVYKNQMVVDMEEKGLIVNQYMPQ